MVARPLIGESGWPAEQGRPLGRLRMRKTPIMLPVGSLFAVGARSGLGPGFQLRFDPID